MLQNSVQVMLYIRERERERERETEREREGRRGKKSVNVLLWYKKN
jgi:hypothetical protein